LNNKTSNRWSSSETRLLIEEVGRQYKVLQKAKDPRKRGRVWNNIISNIQSLLNHVKNCGRSIQNNNFA
ncbi:634_t:CDS:1, partial [Gigaspora rosea]